ncbi:hypothetical protein AB0M46_00005 [Dactylosporangium sp. NPDC051485]|uniref:hypothetical protein n=1 Tax=Dactylosporangium sp. NPDC051485 TaxID=3154846 RepID=UPI00343A0590
MSVLRLPLDVHEPRVRLVLERVFGAAFAVRRAVQRDARARVDAFWAARCERAAAGPEAVRGRLGLSRSGLEHAAYRHLDGAPHLRRYLTKALAMHLADGVWQATVRHLFPDVTGRRHGRPRPGGWWEFAAIPGRARSHTRARKWETFRLVGSLAGHCATFGHGGRLWQPRRMPAVTATAAGVPVRSWWDHDGPFAIVCTGLGGGDLVIPVRLPQGPGRWPVLEHYLADPDRWHKIDLVRHRDPGSPGGWRYEAHLMVLGPGYTSPAVTQRRQAAARLERRGGVDVNVSNLTIVSVPTSMDGGLAASRVARTGDHDTALAAERLRQRRRNRALDRSRRAANPGQYRLSPRQQRRADRRRAAGLPPVQVTVPGGPRVANTAGIPVRAYRHDIASNTYRRLRGRAAADGAARTKAGHTRARITAAALVAVHGASLVVEDADIRVWARRWGRGIHAFTPGMLLTALRRETTAVTAHTGRGPGLVRAGTRHTAWTQHCLCSQRVPKGLADRRHCCPSCGLAGDRDLVAALIGAHTVLTDPAQPATARVDWDAARATLARYRVETINVGLQGALTESTGTHHPDPHHTGGRSRRPQPTTSQHGRWRGARRTFGTSPRQPRMSPTTTPVARTTPERRDAQPELLNKPGITTGLRYRP